MKLFTKYNQVNILATVIIFLLGSFAFYFVTNRVLLDQLDGALDTEDAEVSLYAKEHNALPEIVNTEDQQVYFKEVSTPITRRSYFSKKLWNENEHVTEWTRQLIFGLTVAGKNYQVTVDKSQEKSEGFLKLMVMIATGMIALILVVGNIINRMILKKLWYPFYQSISKIGKYHLQSQEPLKLPTTGTEEFTLLNESLNNMTERLASEYRALKEFTGNAAHEMQTPLAVISGNTESLMQDENVLLHHHKAISTIEEAAKRLSRLNQSLLLLTKIE
ncbi:MAG: histidine kinase dimerization/phospho-acceptor domain-containing protein, partial [Bacteroidota bacterium]